MLFLQRKKRYIVLISIETKPNFFCFCFSPTILSFGKYNSFNYSKNITPIV